MNSIIAIDGPAGAGKSTLAKRLAKRLGYQYLDTGAMFRVVTLYILENDINIYDKEQVLKALNNIRIDFLPDNTNNDSKNKSCKSETNSRILLNNRDVTSKIRTSSIDKNVSDIARIKEVREELKKQQREIALKSKHIIVDGRDIGSQVLPEADYKFFVTASLKERARRRYREHDEDDNRTLTDIENEIKKRDKIDKNRKYAPLKKAEDAVFLDTTDLTIEQAVAKMLEIMEKEG